MSKGRVCLAYSGGLDTSTILVWLLEQGYEVIAYLANVGQNEDWEAVRSKAKLLGATKMIIEDLRQEFIEGPLFSAIKCNAVYEDRYLLGTALARPVIASGMMKSAKAENCDFVSHGCTGKGNDQVRFELAFLALDPSIKIIAPWRDPAFFTRFEGRQALLAYAAEKGIPVEQTTKKPWSMDENIQHCSYEAGILEDPALPPPEDIWKMTDSPENAPNQAQKITIKWLKGIPVELLVDKESVKGSLAIWLKLNSLGKLHGVGRIDIVEGRFIGLKSRGCYDAPAHHILRQGHIDLEGLSLDSNVRAMRDQFVTHGWSRIIYNGGYFSPEREFLENSLTYCQERITGSTDLKLYKGTVSCNGRSSPYSLYSEDDASMDSLSSFDPTNTTGFININAIRLKAHYALGKVDKSGE